MTEYKFYTDDLKEFQTAATIVMNNCNTISQIINPKEEFILKIDELVAYEYHIEIIAHEENNLKNDIHIYYGFLKSIDTKYTVDKPMTFSKLLTFIAKNECSKKESDIKIIWNEPYSEFSKIFNKPILHDRNKFPYFIKYHEPQFIKHIHINKSKKTVAVIFTDGDKQIIKCHKKDPFDPYVGVALAIANHTFESKTQFHKFVNKFIKEDK